MDSEILYKKGDNVQILDDPCFVGKDYKIKSRYFSEPGVIKVYAPWCGHCKSKVKCLNMLAGYLHNHNMQVYVIDGTDNEHFTTMFPTHGFPTFLEVTATGHISSAPLKDALGEPVYTVPAIVSALCGNNKDVCKYAVNIAKCSEQN
jgi:hypothetical protein